MSSKTPAESSAGKQLVSERRRLANQRNAMKSTGPKTLSGKNKVRLNAIKHGLLSTTISLDTLGSPEYQDFRSHIESMLRPTTLVEKKLAEQAASLIWRLKKTECAVRAALNCEIPKVKLESVVRCEARFAAKLREVLGQFPLLNQAGAFSESQNQTRAQGSSEQLKDGRHESE